MKALNVKQKGNLMTFALYPAKELNYQVIALPALLLLVLLHCIYKFHPMQI